MNESNMQIKNAIQEAVNLGRFKSFCDKNVTGEAKRKIRKIYHYTVNPIETTQNMFKNEFDVTISDAEAERLFTLISAFLNKSAYRKAIGNAIKKSLLQSQLHHCAICGCDIDMHAQVDHIVPFKLVGDELENNLQMLCTECNLKKNASLDYQVRFLLKLL